MSDQPTLEKFAYLSTKHQPTIELKSPFQLQVYSIYLVNLYPIIAGDSQQKEDITSRVKCGSKHIISCLGLLNCAFRNISSDEPSQQPLNHIKTMGLRKRQNAAVLTDRVYVCSVEKSIACPSVINNHCFLLEELGGFCSEHTTNQTVAGRRGCVCGD